MFENVDGRTDDGRMTDGRTDNGVIGILIAHLGAFGSGELISHDTFQFLILALRDDKNSLQKRTTIIT